MFIGRINRLSESKLFQTTNWILLVGGGLLCIPETTRTVGAVMVGVFFTECLIAGIVLATGNGPRSTPHAQQQEQGEAAAGQTTKRLGNLPFGALVVVITAGMMAHYGWKAGLTVLLFVLAAVLVSVALKRRRGN